MLCVADGELEDVGETPRAEVPQEEQPASERAGDAGGEDTRARDQLVAELVEALDRRGRGRDSLPAQRERLAALDGPEHGRDLAARSVQMRLDDLQHEPRRDGRVEGVPPALEHGHPRLRREPVRRRDHPEGAAQLGTGRERHARSLRKPSPTGRDARLGHGRTTKYALNGSCSSRCTSIDEKPASARSSRAFSSPHIAPRPSPPCASETVMQCMHEIM